MREEELGKVEELPIFQTLAKRDETECARAVTALSDINVKNSAGQSVLFVAVSSVLEDSVA